MNPIYSPLDEIVNDIFKRIEPNILTLSEEETDQIFNNIDKSIDSSDKCNKLYILEKLRNKFEDQIDYYHPRLHKKYDWNAFLIGIIALIIAVVLVYLSYIAISHYNIIALFKSFKNYDATFHYGEQPCTFAQYADQYIKMINDYLKSTDNNHFFYNKLFIISKLAEPFIYISLGAYVLIRTVLGLLLTVIVLCISHLILKGMVFLFLGAIVIIAFLFISIGLWLWPKDKEYYDKWNTMREKIKKIIFILKKQN